MVKVMIPQPIRKQIVKSLVEAGEVDIYGIGKIRLSKVGESRRGNMQGIVVERKPFYKAFISLSVVVNELLKNKE